MTQDGWLTWANYVLNELKRLDGEIRKLEDGSADCRRDCQKRFEDIMSGVMQQLHQVEGRYLEKQMQTEKQLVELKTKIAIFASLLGFLAGLLPLAAKLLFHL